MTEEPRATNHYQGVSESYRIHSELFDMALARTSSFPVSGPVLCRRFPVSVKSRPSIAPDGPSGAAAV
jgi:hypothetical protein